MSDVVIVDYGLGNLGSIANMIRKCGATSEVSSDPAVIAQAARLILPGVGAFDAGMARIHQSGLTDLLRHKAREERVPFMGICLGMQLLTKGSEEGQSAGLELIDAQCLRFRLPDGLRVPHMGWGEVGQVKSSHYLESLEEETRFYFVHSFFVQCSDERDVLLTCDYGGAFCAAFERDNIMGVQFHPEKSHSFGKKLFTGFLKR
jgi:glutamine amidotransferase